MSRQFDPELEDMLRDPELIRLARMLSTATTPDPPLDDAFRSALRRDLMQRAWGSSERKHSFWRRLAAPPRIAWVGATALVALVALVVLQTVQTPTQLQISSPQSGGTAVALQQPILVSFNQPMDHRSTEQAVQITPPTSVVFTWNGDTTLYVQPTSGNLAPNTQYQVTIGPSAQTRDGKPLTAPQQFTFVTQPTTPLPARPSPTPTGASQLSGVQPLAPLSGGTISTPQWSPDSSTVYFVGANGALEAVPAKGGVARTLVADGVSIPAISAAGDRIAYIRGGQIEILTLATNETSRTAVTTVQTALVWVNDVLYSASSGGIFARRRDGSTTTLTTSPDPSGTFVSIAPDGTHAAFQSARSLLLVDVASGSTLRLGQFGATNFQGWSPDGTRIMHDGVVANMSGQTIGRLPSGDPSWSTHNQILIGSDSGLVEVQPDGSGRTDLASGQFNLPAWAPDATTFVFVRGSALWVASAPSSQQQQPQPSAVDDASAVVDAFMQARLAGDEIKARSYLDDNAKSFYDANGSLFPGRDRGFRRYFILAAELDPSSPDTARVIVRLVFGQAGALDTSDVEEALTLRRASPSDPFRIDRVTVSPARPLGRGPEVVLVRITSKQVAITFDSDLVPSTVAGVRLQDSQGQQVPGSMTYTDRTVTFSGLQLVPGASYRLVVLPAVQDVGNRHAASEYDLDFVGPGADSTPAVVIVSPSPTPGPGGLPGG